MLRLRSAEPADAPVIFDLIGQLADFEQLRPQVTGRIEDLRRHLFGEPRYAHAVLAEWDGSPAGFALYFFNYSTFLCRPGLYLEDLFVRPDHRGRGIGHALLLDLEARARALGCGRLEWSVLNWNQSAIDFYHRFGARPNDGWTMYRKVLPDDSPERPG
ncbi:MAG TPA: GNAT family N-acetyltransferase [Steroidobacteraceae bacterium]|jgi:GNAT superfamily N-acetyltransferase|nr:GNAT family N-acetyltransferase [Steroidobacteraceae bacterium]